MINCDLSWHIETAAESKNNPLLLAFMRQTWHAMPMHERWEGTDFDLEAPLSIGAICEFRDVILKPAVDDLWPKRTCATANPGDNFYDEKHIPIGEREAIVSIKALCEPAEEEADGGDWYDNGKFITINVTVTEQIGSNDFLMCVILDKLSQTNETELIDQIRQGSVAVWQSDTFEFSDDDDEPFYVERWIEVAGEIDSPWACALVHVCEPPIQMPGDNVGNIIYVPKPNLIDRPESALSVLDSYKIEAALGNLDVAREIIDTKTTD